DDREIDLLTLDRSLQIAEARERLAHRRHARRRRYLLRQAVDERESLGARIERRIRRIDGDGELLVGGVRVAGERQPPQAGNESQLPRTHCPPPNNRSFTSIHSASLGARAPHVRACLYSSSAFFESPWRSRRMPRLSRASHGRAPSASN